MRYCRKTLLRLHLMECISSYKGVFMEDKEYESDEFYQAILAKRRFYHIHHPYHRMMYEGQATKEQIQAWVANRYYYQIKIPQKDLAILANCPDYQIRQQWLQRVMDQDGTTDREGGREAWLNLALAVGLTKEQVISEALVLPGVRFAVDAYVNFARQTSWQEAASSSLTELFAPEIHQSRLSTWPQHYPWINPNGYQYFKSRLNQAPRDVELGLKICLATFKDQKQQKRMLEILQFKLDVLWSILDALTLAYVHHQKPYFSVTSEHVWHKGVY